MVMNNDIEVLDMKNATKPGTIKAYCKVSVNKVTIDGVKVIQQDGQDAWVAMPSKEWEDKDGKKKYSPIVTLPKDLQSAVQADVLEFWNDN